MVFYERVVNQNYLLGSGRPPQSERLRFWDLVADGANHLKHKVH